MQDNGFVGFLAVLLCMAALTVLVPLAARIADSILLAILLGPFRLYRRFRQLPLHEKNRVRATGGAAALIGCAALALKGFPLIGAKPTGLIAAMAALYLIVGIKGSHGAQYDFFSAFWYAATALGGVALLVFIRVHGW
jgi:hypothetical protein